MLQTVLQKHLQFQAGGAQQHHRLRAYVDVPLAQIGIRMRRERTPANAAQWAVMDPSQTLRSQLVGHTIVEFPELVVILLSDAAKYDGHYPQSGGRIESKGLPAAHQLPAAAISSRKCAGPMGGEIGCKRTFTECSD